VSSAGGALNRNRIIDTALALARANGMAGVSMRRLGRELGVQPMSLYHHVPSRAALMVLMADRSVSEIPEPNPELPWEERLVDLLLQTYQAGVEDPAVFPVLASELLSTGRLPDLQPESNAASSGLINAVLALLDEAGMSEARRPTACRGLIGLVVGFIAGRVDASMTGAGVDAAIPVPVTGWPACASDGQGTAAATADPGDPVDGLRFGLELFAKGLTSVR